MGEEVRGEEKALQFTTQADMVVADITITSEREKVALLRPELFNNIFGE